jgi:hypothetical protein
MANRAHSGRCFRAARRTARRKLGQMASSKHHQVLAGTAVAMGLSPSLALAARQSIQELGYQLKTGWHKLARQEAARVHRGAARGQ